MERAGGCCLSGVDIPGRRCQDVGLTNRSRPEAARQILQLVRFDLPGSEMSIVLPILAVAFAAFCVWLAVRIVNRGERWAKWTLVGTTVSIPVLCVGSLGPVCWKMAPNRHFRDSRFVRLYARPDGVTLWGHYSDFRSDYYRDLYPIMARPGRVGDLLRWWAELGTDKDVIPMYNKKYIRWGVPTEYR